MGKKIQGVHHIAIRPTEEQYRKTVDFYTRLLGMEVINSWGDSECPCMMVSCGDNSCIEILNGETVPAAPGPLCHLALATDRVDEIIEEVRAAGYQIKAEPRDGNLGGQEIRVAFFYGPVGEEIELFWVK